MQVIDRRVNNLINWGELQFGLDKFLEKISNSIDFLMFSSDFKT